jgi:uncharacterized protein YgfB (UPF0149 family)
MTSLSTYDWGKIGSALRDAGSLGEPSEIHGEFCGLVCVMGQDAVASWPAAALADASSPSDDARGSLRDLAAASWASLDSGDMSFELLLPSDAESLERRAESLGLWCQGFMHGVGASGRSGAKTALADHEVIKDIIGDFSEITRAAFADDETEEEGEAAFIELVEYVRVSVQLVFEEFLGIRSDAGSEAH